MTVEVHGFEILSELGSGATAIVYEARRDGREVALKVARDELGAGARARFAAEAATLKSLEHPALVPLLDAGVLDDGRPYLCFPLLRGELLSARLALGPLPIDEAMRLCGEIGGALTALHAAGVVHRDVKPENVMLVDGGRRAVLLDLGIAKHDGDPATTATREGLVRGTPAYMAPERFFGQPASVRSDVYELAVTLFFMLTGVLPWEREDDPGDRMVPRDPRELCPALSDAAAGAILRALSTRVETRPGSVAAFLGALGANEAAAARTTATTRTTAPSPRPEVPAPDAKVEEPRPARGRLPRFLAAAVVALAALGSVTFWQRRTSSPVAAAGAPSASGIVGETSAASTGLPSAPASGPPSTGHGIAASASAPSAAPPSTGHGIAASASAPPARSVADETRVRTDSIQTGANPAPPEPVASPAPAAPAGTSAEPAASVAPAAPAAPELIPACQRALAIWCSPELTASRAGPFWCNNLRSDLEKYWAAPFGGNHELRVKTTRGACEVSIASARASYRTVLGVEAPY